MPLIPLPKLPESFSSVSNNFSVISHSLIFPSSELEATNFGDANSTMSVICFKCAIKTNLSFIMFSWFFSLNFKSQTLKLKSAPAVIQHLCKFKYQIPVCSTSFLCYFKILLVKLFSKKNIDLSEVSKAIYQIQIYFIFRFADFKIQNKKLVIFQRRTKLKVLLLTLNAIIFNFMRVLFQTKNWVSALGKPNFFN